MQNPYWHEYYKPHSVDFDEIRHLCFVAFSIIGASRSLIGRSSEEISGNIHLNFFEKAEITLTKTFLDIAVSMRTFEDILAAHEIKEEYDSFINSNFDDDQLGSIDDGKDISDRKGLPFREVCNKIIHAEDFRYVYSNGSNPRDEDFAWGMEGTIELKGKLGKKTWDAWIFAEEFIEACMLISMHFDRDDDKTDELAE